LNGGGPRAICFYLVMTAIVLIPVVLFEVPAQGDYLSHLARMHILADHDRSEALRRYYDVHWLPLPYLFMDASFLVLNKLAPIYTAGRIFTGLCVLLPVAATAALHRTLHGRFSLVPAISFLFCYNYLLSWGFINFLPALCVAVIAFALWVAAEPWSRWTRAALFSVISVVVFLSHLVAFAVLCLLIGGFELTRAARAGFRPAGTIALDWLAAGGQALPAVAIGLTVDIGTPFIGAAPTRYGDFSDKFVALISPFLYLDFEPALLIALILGAGVYLGIRGGFLSLSRALWPTLVLIALVAAAMPVWFLGNWGMDFRLPLLLAMLLTAATATTLNLTHRAGATILGALFVLTALNVAVICVKLAGLNTNIAEAHRVLATLPAGARMITAGYVAPGTQRPFPRSATEQVPFIALIDRDVFVPNLYSALTTVRPVAAMRDSSTPTGGMVPWARFVDGYGKPSDPAVEKPDGDGGRVYWLGWENKFDFVLVQHFGGRPDDVPPNLVLKTRSDTLDLYAIDNARAR
jgi:hypothetical protein